DPDGQRVWQAQIDPWGQLLNESGPLQGDQPLRLPGQWQDEETGLHYNRFRYYDPQLGRYVTQDPVGISGGSNLYRFGSNMPETFIDPMGLVGELKLEGPSFFKLTTFEAAKKNVTLDQAVANGALTRTVTLPAIGIAASPDAIALTATAGQPMCTAARTWYMSGSEVDAAWRSMSLKDKLLYEIGQKTTSSYGKYAALDPVARGAAMVKDMGWFGALAPESGGLVLGAGTTLSTGPTPLFRWLVPRLLGGSAVGTLPGDTAKP
ncbi:RHS repeat-associated core domain-containing protein, partial [Parachitinimonas caeni]